MNTAFITFVYPGASVFFPRFIDSLNLQSDKIFTLIIFNDGCNDCELEIFKKRSLFQINIIENICNSISENRMSAFKKLANSSFDNFIFGDIDDSFSCNRVEVIKEELKKNEIVFNELTLVNTNADVLKSKLVTSYLDLKSKVTFDMVKYKNLIGFSHLAIGKSAMKFLATQEIDKQINIVDWVVITKLLTVWEATFEHNVVTFYVVHENNIGLDKEYNYEAFQKELDIKLTHYQEIQKLDRMLKYELAQLTDLKSLIANNLVNEINWDCFVFNKQNEYYPWWNKLKHGKELEYGIQIRRSQKF